MRAYTIDTEPLRSWGPYTEPGPNRRLCFRPLTYLLNGRFKEFEYTTRLKGNSRSGTLILRFQDHPHSSSSYTRHTSCYQDCRH